MIFSLLGFRKVVVFVLVAIMAIPCSLKRELPLGSATKTSNQPTQQQNKNACLTFFKLEKQHKKEGKQIDFRFFLDFPSEIHFSSRVKTNLSFHYFTQQRGKTPSYLLHQRFLI
ncbi:hypothetical protein [Cyclobacterium jeungdonense]|uniref:Secreted protein n=1 Tax=Cyclobacterium jeungdonense TaxID=708087 RepID=A0ABT8C5P7_9BACT|nr:hypothetical protein [Cyclobacterium jeungdonense]MDN3688118.1 hypothetical protein [Cyclobacterium jeungdonense]